MSMLVLGMTVRFQNPETEHVIPIGIEDAVSSQVEKSP